MEQPEAHRNRWALGLSITFSVLIFVSFAFYKGFFNFGSVDLIGSQKSKSQVANVISADVALSPIQNTKATLGAAFKEIGKKYEELKTSVSNVFVPFVTGIEVYERK